LNFLTIYIRKSESFGVKSRKESPQSCAAYS